MPPVPRNDPYTGYNFEVSVNGVSNDGKAVSGSFSEVSGLEAAMDPIDYRTGSEDIRHRKLPGLKKFPNIVLKKGITGNIEFWGWIVKGMSGTVFRTDGTISLLDENKAVVMQWKFKRGWACKWTGPGLNAKNNEVAIETVEICHEGLTIDGDGQPG